MSAALSNREKRAIVTACLDGFIEETGFLPGLAALKLDIIARQHYPPQPVTRPKVHFDEHGTPYRLVGSRIEYMKGDTEWLLSGLNSSAFQHLNADQRRVVCRLVAEPTEEVEE